MTLKKMLSICLLLLLFMSSKAQHSITYVLPDKSFYDGKELFSQRKYAASYRSFENYLSTASNTDAGMIQEAEYYLANNAYQLEQKNAEELLLAYIAQHPYSPFYHNTYYMLGLLRYKDKDYANALDYLRLVDETQLLYDDQLRYLFSRGYANLEMGNSTKALEIFKTLKSINSAYQPSARYYTGYTQYLLGNYDEALRDLLSIEKNPQFEESASYNIVQIYYAKENYAEVEKRTSELLKKYPNNKSNSELYRMIGEKAFRDKDYLKAAKNLKQYESTSTKVLRMDIYYLGISCLKIEEPAEAIKYLSQVTTQQDEISESAYLQLGNAYIKLNDKDNARMAYEVATRTSFNSQVREEALFNYALTTYETNAPFGESIAAFEQFINDYPNSENIDRAYDYLSTVYLTSKNYKASYESILKISNLTPQLRETKQYLEYQVGTEEFTSGNYAKAIESFTKAIQSAPNGRYLADAYFWRGESYYRINDFVRSVSDFNAFFTLPQISSNPNYKQAYYSLGYSYFRQKKYGDSLAWFLKYIAAEKDQSSLTYTDALSRIGDVYYSQRNFTKADEYYSKAMTNKSYGDYALFQSAYMYGVQKDYSRKISRLEKLLVEFPNSEYGDDALYEIGRSYVMLENNQKVIETYQRLLTTYPNSTFAPKAQLEIGMLYFNSHDYTKAAPIFKKVIADYPASDEANIALESLETIHINTNTVDEYIRYSKSLGKDVANTSVTKADSITFAAAEKLYMNADYSSAINRLKEYIKNFCPSGKFCSAAQYYLADSYYSTGNKSDALIQYINVLNQRGNPHGEEAALRAAEIAYDQADYTAALNYFTQLNETAQSTENKNIARLGILRCNNVLNKTETIIQSATAIISDSKSTVSMQSEALLSRAKGYTQLKRYSDALKDLKAMSIDTRTAVGAEARYLLAEVYYNLNQLNNAEKEVLDFAKQGTPFQYWLARGFLVLSDVSVKKGDDFQAKQYLLSLQKNYTVQDEIQEMINTRLRVIEKRANENVIN